MNMKPLSTSRSLLVLWLAVALTPALAKRAAAAEPGRSPAVAPEPAVVVPEPVMPGTWQLAGFDPGLPLSDLEALRKVIGKAEIVGLGESEHTSGGLYQVKHRVVRYLVEKLGFRLFAIESPLVMAEQTAAFVERCEGSADQALAGIYSIWSSTETRDLLQWMCDWNQAHKKAKDKIRFTGFDIHEAAPDAAALRAFLAKLGWAEDDPRSLGLAECSGVLAHDLPGRVPPARYDACIGSVNAISEYLATNAKAVIKKTSKRDLEFAKLWLARLRAEEDQLALGDGTSPSRSARNHGLAFTLVKLRELRYPKLKTVVWTSNVQIAKEGTAGPPWNYVTVGALLRAWLGTKYLPIAVAADQVSIDWPQVGCGPVAAYGQPGSYEQALNDLGLGDVLVDLRASGVVPQVLPDGEHALGGTSIDIRRQFDALLYLDVSPKMQPLSWPPCL
jgi:erythromycin esterase